jgi:hypothetical protein
MADNPYGVFNQVLWSGVGDVDECWIIATYWALVITGVVKRKDLPTIKEFRAAAGRPDRPGASGGNNTVIAKALTKLLPKADAQLYNGNTAGFEKMLKQGYVASLSVDSGDLPAYLQFGFKGDHQISVYFEGGQFWIMNPLAKEGSALIQISRAALQKAAGSYLGDGKFHAIFIRSKSKEEMDYDAAIKDYTKRSARPHAPKPLPPPAMDKFTNYLQPYWPKSFYGARTDKSDMGNLK